MVDSHSTPAVAVVDTACLLAGHNTPAVAAATATAAVGRSNHRNNLPLEIAAARLVGSRGRHLGGQREGRWVGRGSRRPICLFGG